MLTPILIGLPKSLDNLHPRARFLPRVAVLICADEVDWVRVRQQQVGEDGQRRENRLFVSPPDS